MSVFTLVSTLVSTLAFKLVFTLVSTLVFIPIPMSMCKFSRMFDPHEMKNDMFSYQKNTNEDEHDLMMQGVRVSHTSV